MLEAEPQTYKKAISSSEGPLWKEAIKSVIDSIMQNHTWKLVDLPPWSKPLISKWIFKWKMKADGTIDKYKARFLYHRVESLFSFIVIQFSFMWGIVRIHGFNHVKIHFEDQI